VGVGPVGAGVIVAKGVGLGGTGVAEASAGKLAVTEPWGTFQGS